MAIRHRNNSLFYRSQRGAQVGDIYMSIIHTTEIHGGNAFHYLTALMRHPTAVAESPGAWLPWNYRETLARFAGGKVPSAERGSVPHPRDRPLLDVRVPHLGPPPPPSPQHAPQ